MDPYLYNSAGEEAPPEEEDQVEPPFGERIVPGVPEGAEPAEQIAPEVSFVDVNGKKMGKDLRVKSRVPGDYLVRRTRGPNDELFNLDGIIFPYTPSISYEAKADYSAATPLHSNFAINFYQRSSISSISITGKFTVQNAKDAGVYLSTVYLLKALTKMRSGSDSNSGAPPPVCRLDAHGEMMMLNVPVAITSFRVELPDSVDYFTYPGRTGRYGVTSVPTISTIAITCLPMYSRNEMQQFSVTGYLSDISYAGKGYL